jgi:hypothetical protein
VNITCEDRERILLDGSAEQWAAWEQHAASCAACAEELRVWRQLSTAAAELRDYQDSPALWSKLEASLRAQQATLARKPFGGLPDLWRLCLRGWRLGLVGAMAVFLAAAGGYLYTHRPPSDPLANAKLLKSRALANVERAERDYMAAIDKLAAEAGPELKANTPLMANYREKLLVLDGAIADLRAQAGENPSNAYLRYQLLAMYEEKQQTLQDVLETKR